MSISIVRRVHFVRHIYNLLVMKTRFSIHFQLYVYFMLYSCMSFHSFSQPSVHQVLAVAAGHVEAEEVSMYWTIGESMVVKHDQDNVAVYEGFQQGNYAYDNSIGNTPSSTPIVGDKVRYYPNPVETDLNIDDPDLDIHTVLAYNDAGQHLFSYNRSSHEQIISINMAHLPTGLYFFRLLGSDGFLIQNFRVYKR